MTARQEQILSVARRSSSYAEAARELGLSRERVRKVASRSSSIPEGFETLEKAALRLRYRPNYLRQMLKAGHVEGRQIVYRWYVPIEAELNLGTCVICGRALPKWKRMYCSDTCADASVARNHRRKYAEIKESTKMAVQTAASRPNDRCVEGGMRREYQRSLLEVQCPLYLERQASAQGRLLPTV